MKSNQNPCSHGHIIRWFLVVIACAYGLKQALSAVQVQPTMQPAPQVQQNQVLEPRITPSVQQPNRAASEDFVFINATPFLLNVQFFTPQDVLVTQPVNSNGSYIVRRKPASVTVYAREGEKPIPITPDMIVNGSFSAKFEVAQPQAQPQVTQQVTEVETQLPNPSIASLPTQAVTSQVSPIPVPTASQQSIVLSPTAPQQPISPSLAPTSTTYPPVPVR